MQQRQHAVIKMEITLNLLQKYHKPNIPESGNNIKYDIREMKTSHGKLNLWYQQRVNKKYITTDTPEPQQNPIKTTAQENWVKLKTQIEHGLKQCYPVDEKIKQRQAQTNHEKWDKEEEKERRKTTKPNKNNPKKNTRMEKRNDPK